MSYSLGSVWRSVLTFVVLLVSTSVLAAIPVSTLKLHEEPIELSYQFSGRAEALSSVELVSRTEGFLEKIYFSDGQYIAAGMPLYQLDSAQHHAALKLAESQVSGAEATLRNHQQLLDRYERLNASNSISQNELDNARAQRDIAQAALAQANAQLRTQQLNYEYTVIRAPISGRIGSSNVHVGALINSSTGTLVEIVQLDPIRVAFSINERDFLLKSEQFSSLEKLKQAYTPYITLHNRTIAGELVSVNNRVNSSSGSILLRAEFANEQQNLLPGANVTLSLSLNEKVDVILLPATALLQDINSHYVFVVNDEDRVEKRNVVIGNQIDRQYIVTSGLNSGEQVIVSGVQRISAGMVVAPQLISQ